MELKRYYISLCRGLFGYYVAVDAVNEEVVRTHALRYFGKIWTSVYDKPYDKNGAKCIVINENDPIVLNDNPEWE